MLMSATQSKPILGLWIENQKSLALKIAAVLGGIVFLSILAQVAIPLPFTPVPITGQTFGVAFLSLMMGRRWGLSSVVSYVALGAAGLPLFAQGHSGLTAISSGYLVGMCVSSFVIGTLSDKGWSRSFGKTLLTCALGSFCVYTFGVIVLANFLPLGSLFAKGVLPFIPGDIVKSTLAATLASKLNSQKK